MPVDPNDLPKILNRDPAIEMKALFDGFESLAESRTWGEWRNKYRVKLSVPIKDSEIAAAYERGMLRSSELQDGKYYWGLCRNANVALWSERHQVFFHNRKKGGWRVDRIRHPEDEVVIRDIYGHGRPFGEDVFLPYLEVQPIDWEIVDSTEIKKADVSEATNLKA
jgi:hypothetical protein